MKTVKTSELTGKALDWAVELTERVTRKEPVDTLVSGDIVLLGFIRRYSSDWAQGGPIIEREGVCISPSAAGRGSWIADTPLKPTSFAIKTRCSRTPLIAAMRCFVASKLGDTVSIPCELV